MNSQDLVCRTCGRANPSGFSFCGTCGAALERSCPACGSLAPGGLAFCGRCGTRLDDPPVRDSLAIPMGPIEAISGPDNAIEERKVVTVLYADLVSSTELATRLDPEELRGILGPFFDAMAAEIAHYAGSVEKYIGDAIVAVFGHPVAHEDHAERAVRAALAMQDRLGRDSKLVSTTDGRLSMRIGVNTSEVLAGPGSDRGGTVTGDAISLAARLQTLAPEGSVVVADRTRRLTRRAFAYRGMGEATIKGFARPVALWEVVRDRRPDPEPSDLRSALVGRDGELVLLRALFDRIARARAPTLVTLVGPPGIGKSRLAQEFAGLISTARVVRGRCLPYGDGVAYWPMAEILKADAGILDSDPQETIVAKASARLDPRFVGEAEAFGTTQVLLSSIGIGLGSDPLAGLEPVAARRAIAFAWRRYFESISVEQPVIALIEDIHWADAGLLDLLESLAATVSGPLLLVCTARPEVREHRPSWGAGLANASTVALSPLSSADGVELIRRLLDDEAPPGIVERVVRQSEGNPFYVGELLRMMVEDGTLERSADGWRATRPLSSSMPDTVQGVIASRIDLLSRAGKRAIQDASVVGRVFWPGVLARLGPADMIAAADELVDKGLVMEHEVSAIEGERELMFNHILTRDVAYASVPRARRALAHAVVLDWIEGVTSGRDEEFAEILSHHASEAGDLERTARFAMLAGHRQRRVFAAEEAIRWYDRAIAALDRLSTDPAALTRVETMLSRGEACEQLGRFGDARADYECALEAAGTRPVGRREWLEGRALAAIVQVLWTEGRLRDAEKLLPTALAAAVDQGADDLVARLSSGAGSAALLRGDPANAVALHERALAVATAADDREGEAVARHGLAEAALVVGPFDEGIRQARRADELFRELGQRPLVHRNEQLIGVLLWLDGELDQAVTVATAAIAGCRDVGNRGDLASALGTLGLLAVSGGDLGMAMRCVDEAVAIAGELDAPRLRVAALAWRCVVLAELRARQQLGDDVASALVGADATGEWLFRGPLLAARGWSEAGHGAPEAALATFEEASEAAAGAPFAAMLVGRFQLLAGEASGAPDLLAAGADRIAVASGGKSPPFQAWAAFGAALATMDRGDPAGAEVQARQALALASAAGESPVRWRSLALLGEALGVLGRVNEAVAARREAADALAPIMAGLDDNELRVAFAGRPDVSAVIPTAERPPRRR
jgi:class 3 adenylate cyclase/tetratricopeptide (TPR) repeat protein